MAGRKRGISWVIGLMITVVVFILLAVALLNISTHVASGVERKAEAVSKIGLVDVKLDIDSSFNVVLYLVPHTTGDYRLLILYENGTAVEKTYYGLSSVASLVIDNIYTGYVPFKVYVISLSNGMIVGSLTDQQVYGVRYLPNVKFNGWVDKDDLLRAMGLENTERFNGFIEEVGSKAYTYSGLVNKLFLDYRSYDMVDVSLSIAYDSTTNTTTISIYLNGTLANTTSFPGVTGTATLLVTPTVLFKTLFGYVSLDNVTVSIQPYGWDYYIYVAYGLSQTQVISSVNYTFVYVVDADYVANLNPSGYITVYEIYPLGVIAGNGNTALQIAEGTTTTRIGFLMICGISGSYSLTLDVNRMLMAFFE